MSDYVALLRANRNYRNLWLGRVVSNLGDWFNLLASATLIATLTDAGTAISYLFLARFVPVFVMSPLAGVLADRYNRRNIMIAADILRAATVLCFLLVRSPDQLWLLYVLTALQFVLSALYTPAHSAVLSNIVEPEELVAANTLDAFTWSTMLAVGSLLGGIAAALFGVATAFVIDAGTFLLSAWFVARIQLPPRQVAEHHGGGFLDFMDGLRYLRGARFILVLSLVKAGGALIWGAINVLEIPLANQVFAVAGNGAVALGILYAVTGLGTGLGPILIRRTLGDSRPALLGSITLGFVLLTAGVFWLAQAPSLAWGVGATLTRSLGTGALWVFSSALLQMSVADRFRGRVFAFEFAVLTLTQSLSTLWAGLAQDSLGLSPQQVLVTMGLASVVVTAVWAVVQARAVRVGEVVTG